MQMKFESKCIILMLIRLTFQHVFLELTELYWVLKPRFLSSLFYVCYVANVNLILFNDNFRINKTCQKRAYKTYSPTVMDFSQMKNEKTRSINCSLLLSAEIRRFLAFIVSFPFEKFIFSITWTNAGEWKISDQWLYRKYS